MTGSVMDGEDVVQDALFQGYRKLDTFDDFLRRREVRQDAEEAAAEPDSVMPVDPPGPILAQAAPRMEALEGMGLAQARQECGTSVRILKAGGLLNYYSRAA
jgi:hypothetical protein